MKLRNLAIFFCWLWALPAAAQKADYNRITLVVHGGAGTIRNLAPEQEAAYTAALQEALQAGFSILSNGGSSLDAVEAAIRVMEDSPLFNAGKGAVFTHEGRNELDASIMDGQTGRAGAVAGVTTVKNPVSAARAVMEKSAHVLLAGKGAEAFAAAQQLEIVAPEYFRTEPRLRQLQYLQEQERRKAEQADTSGFRPDSASWDGRKYGTVGAVALDAFGNLAAGTSTGGMTNKRYGRIGDSPIIGAGTWAENQTCAVSSTGHGEFFIRNVVAYDIAARMKYKKQKLKKAANEVVMKKLVRIGGEGGVIALDAHGTIAMPFNSAGMFRGYMKAGGKTEVKIYK